METIKQIRLNIAGMGVIFYSPFAVSKIAEEEDYLESSFEDPMQVKEQALQGRIVGINLGTPGSFILNVLPGYPSEERVNEHRYRLRAGVEVRDGILCVRDLFDLIKWKSKLPERQVIELKDGFYHLTFLSNDPASGVLGDEQVIEIYLNHLDEMPNLRFEGVPTLC